MPYLLDSNVITRLLKRTPQVIDRYRTVLESRELVYLSVVVYAAYLWADCRRQGRPHDDDGDLLIAAQANTLGAVIVTRNTRDFADLQAAVENWEE